MYVAVTHYMTYVSGCSTLSSGVADNSAEVWTNKQVDNQANNNSSGTNTKIKIQLSYHQR